MSKTIALLGALDTKGAEYQFVKECIERRGHRTLVIDVGVLGPPAFPPDIGREEVAQTGGGNAEALRQQKDRGQAMAVMSRGAVALLAKLHTQRRFDAVLALGGTGGTSLACAAMRALPMGVPKVMVSTVAGGDVSGYVGVTDIVMVPSIVDVSGINRISREVFSRAVGSVCGMVETEVQPGRDKPLIAASMFGNTTPAVERARSQLERQGYEVLVFHCTGTGGRTMESLIHARMIAGVLDITTTEWADELVGGVLSAGPARLAAAARCGAPAIVAPGCLDMVNFGAPPTVPAAFKGRKFYPHNPNVTLMRTTPEENGRLGKVIAARLNQSTGPVTVLLPLQGVSMIDAPGGPFWWPEANQALFAALKQDLRQDIPVVELDCNINDPLFADACVKHLLANMALAPAAGS
ncbi:MAG TPA: Tm-1-like ATP-binding domain-containing protein [Candidatus Paceibacterota bacterium]|nr:Tm-1-like ATP-binding domain-containing protein [Verrucomicrobiota bacterium]HSA12856.1 Tm-1-like ATP-binding domain-containing protein [Candidatus Paceibacterota bacterium]